MREESSGVVSPNTPGIFCLRARYTEYSNPLRGVTLVLTRLVGTICLIALPAILDCLNLSARSFYRPAVWSAFRCIGGKSTCISMH